MPAKIPCLTCGRLTRGRSYCSRHEPVSWKVRPSPSSQRGRDPALRRRVLERDGHACVSCGSRKRLRVHHLRRVADGGANSEANCVTLCQRCHLAEHRAAQAREVEEQAEDALLLGLL